MTHQKLRVYFALLFNTKEHSYFRKATTKRDVPSVVIADRSTFVFLLNQIGFYNRLLFLPQKRGSDLSFQKRPHISFWYFPIAKGVFFSQPSLSWWIRYLAVPPRSSSRWAPGARFPSLAGLCSERSSHPLLPEQPHAGICTRGDAVPGGSTSTEGSSRQTSCSCEVLLLH